MYRVLSIRCAMQGAECKVPDVHCVMRVLAPCAEFNAYSLSWAKRKLCSIQMAPCAECPVCNLKQLGPKTQSWLASEWK